MGGCISYCIKAKKVREKKAIKLGKRRPAADSHSSQSEDSFRDRAPFSFDASVSHSETAYQILLRSKVQDIILNLERNQCPIAQFQDFDVLGYLNKGAFGMVFKVLHRTSNELYALKVQSKQEIFNRKKVDQVISEKRILASLDHVFIVKLFYAFKDNVSIFLVLELAPCGDFLRLLAQRNYLSEKHAKLYAAQIVLVFEYLHAANILFRDLKPENILVARDGYLKVTDFGYAKRVFGYTVSFCGTLEYLAPEQVLKKPYAQSVDWWALGVLIFEMLHGHSPFASPGDDDKLIERIKKDEVPFEAEMRLSSEAKDIIVSLLEKNCADRLGVLRDGVQDVKRHPWFSDLRFFDVFKKAYPAPVVPKVIVNVKPFKPEDIPSSAHDRYKTEFANF